MTRNRFSRASAGISLALLFLSTVPGSAQVAYPPRPAKYEAHFRYRIRADRDDRIRQFRSMERYLKGLGFVASAREDADLDVFDQTAERMHGTIPSANVVRMLEEEHVQTVLLIPEGMQLPQDATKQMQVRIGIPGGLAPREQRQLHEQVIAHLGVLGFRENVGYDHIGFQIIRGVIPAGELMNLLKDLRTQPSGWFAPLISPETLPMPFRATLPIRIVETLRDLPEAAPAPGNPPPAAVPPADPAAVPVAISPKMTPDLVAALADPMAGTKPIRVDLILQSEPGAAWRDVRFRIRSSAEGVSVEGQVGVVVTVRLQRAQDIGRLAELAEVRSIRLPRVGSDTARQGLPVTAKPADVLTTSRIAELHKQGYRGKGTRIAVIGSDFPGALGMIGTQLPRVTRVVDLTAELSPDLLPNPTDANRAAIGPAVAMAAHLTAPDAELALVRVDPSAFHQLMTVTRAIAGDQNFSEAMQSRSMELIKLAEVLSTRRNVASEDYRRAYSTLSDEPVAVKRREDARAAFDKLLEDERNYKAAVQRFAALKAALDGLRGSTIVIGTLVWETGFPQDGMSELSRLLDEQFAPKPVQSSLKAYQMPTVPVWVQAASMSIGQVWAGSFHDFDENGVLEFGTRSSEIPSKRWTRELNFLGFTVSDANPVTVLPAGAKIRITVQWREPRDPEGFGPRESNFPLKMRLLRQIDPDGKNIPSDEFAEAATSSGIPVRLFETASSAAYEQSLEFSVPADGVYALRVEGRYAYEYPIPALRQNSEFSPRIVIESADALTTRRGRPVFITYTTRDAGVGVPGDAPAVVTIGIQGKDRKPVDTLTGAGPGIQLRVKPDLITNGTMPLEKGSIYGSAISAGYAGGAAASLRSAGVRASNLIRSYGLQPGFPMELPLEWLTTLATQRAGARER